MCIRDRFLLRRHPQHYTSERVLRRPIELANARTPSATGHRWLTGHPDSIGPLDRLGYGATFRTNYFNFVGAKGVARRRPVQRAMERARWTVSLWLRGEEFLVEGRVSSRLMSRSLDCHTPNLHPHAMQMPRTTVADPEDALPLRVTLSLVLGSVGTRARIGQSMTTNHDN